MYSAVVPAKLLVPVRAVIPAPAAASIRIIADPGCSVITGLEAPPFGVHVMLKVWVAWVFLRYTNKTGETGRAIEVGEVPKVAGCASLNAPRLVLDKLESAFCSATVPETVSV